MIRVPIPFGSRTSRPLDSLAHVGEGDAVLLTELALDRRITANLGDVDLHP